MHRELMLLENSASLYQLAGGLPFEINLFTENNLHKFGKFLLKLAEAKNESPHAFIVLFRLFYV